MCENSDSRPGKSGSGRFRHKRGVNQMHSSPSESKRAERERVLTLTGAALPFRLAETRGSIAAALFCAIALIPSLLWAVRDRRVWPWDQAWYGEVSVDLWYLFTHAPRQWLGMMATALSMKPPGAAWMGQFFVPLRHAFGSVEAALLFSILLTQLAVLLLIYRISVDVAPDSRGIGFIAVAAAAGAQAFIGLSHQYLVEPLQCLAIAWTILIALRCNQWPRARTLIHLASSALLGMMAKASTPVYSLVPIGFIVMTLIRSRQPWDFRAEWRRWPSRALIYGFLVSGAFGSLWYGINYAAVLQHVRDASSGEIALDYGFRAPAAQKYLLWLRLLEQAFLEPYLAWMLGFLVLAAGGAVLIVRVPFSRLRRPLLIVALSVAQIALVLFAFALNDALETRYLYALLPYVAIVITVLCSAARYRAVQALVVVVCLAQWVTVNRASLAPAPVLTNQFPWLNPIVTDATSQRELSEVVRRTSIFRGYNIVGVEEPWLNANSAAFFAAKNRLDTGVRSYYTSLGYAEKDTAAALKRIEAFSTRFVITLDEPFQSAPDFLNLVTLPVLRELKQDERFTRVPFPNGKGIVIFERQSRASEATHP
jgi:hypothetical protein